MHTGKIVPDAKLPALTEVSVPATDDLVYTVDVSDTTDDPTGSSRKLSLTRLGGFLDPSLCNGRLTTESGVPISTSDRLAQSVVYFTPYNGNRISLFDGTRWKLFSFSEVGLVLSGLINDKSYDIFAYDDAGTLTLELSAAWANSTTRTDALTLQDGVYVKSGATTRRYLGTIHTTSTSTTEDSGGGITTQVGGKRFVWNLYNQVPRHLSVVDKTDTWTYSTAAWRQANGATGNRVEFVCGLDGVPVNAQLTANTAHTATGSVTGIGLDSVTTQVGTSGSFYSPNGFQINLSQTANYRGIPGIGSHYLAWLEYATANVTFYGDAGTAVVQSGLHASIMG